MFYKRCGVIRLTETTTGDEDDTFTLATRVIAVIKELLVLVCEIRVFKAGLLKVIQHVNPLEVKVIIVDTGN